MLDSYFVVKLVDETFMDFDKKCNAINYKDDNFVVFKNVDPKNDIEFILAIIPSSRINIIEQVSDHDW